MQLFVVVFISALLTVADIFPSSAQVSSVFNCDPAVIRWIDNNLSPATKLPYSFYIPPQHQRQIFQQMDDAGVVNGIIERVITKNGLDIYDGAVYQIVQTMLAGKERLQQAQLPLKYYWSGAVGEMWNIRAGFPINKYIYNAASPAIVSSNPHDEGKRGFVFRIINADGDYLVSDPKNGQTRLVGFPQDERLHWVDWKPVAGENAWVVIAAMQLYHRKYFDTKLKTWQLHPESIELKLAKELARAAMILQADCGGIRMAPLGTFRNLNTDEANDFTSTNWWFNHISTENNISWYAAFRMLHQVTKDNVYLNAMQRIEKYMRFVWDEKKGYFHQGAYEVSGWWKRSEQQFALDVQTWAICCFGPAMIDGWFGTGTARRLWETAKAHAGVFNKEGQIVGVGYTDEHDRISVEWSAGAMVALDAMISHYQQVYPQWAHQALHEKLSIRQGMETLRSRLWGGKAAYSYSSKRGAIPFGWNSHAPQVMSMASTGWMVLVDAGVDPFWFLPKN